MDTTESSKPERSTVSKLIFTSPSILWEETVVMNLDQSENNRLMMEGAVIVCNSLHPSVQKAVVASE